MRCVQRRTRRDYQIGSFDRLESRELLASPVAVDDLFQIPEDQTLNVGPAFLVMNSQPGDYIGGGVNRAFGPADGTLSGSAGSGGVVHLSFTSNGFPFGEWWYLDFAAPSGTPLTVGTYTGATRYPFQSSGSPGLSIDGDGRGCNTLTGSFTITAIQFNTDGSLARFAANFEQHCEGGPAALTGSVSYPFSTTPGGVLTNDTNPDGIPLTAMLINGPSHGKLSLDANGGFTYTPDLHYSGPDSFTYQASDGTNVSNTATVFLTVTPVNYPPVAVAHSFTATEGTPLTVAAPGVLTGASDVEGEPISAVLSNKPSNGQLTLSDEGSFTYVSNPGFTGYDSFSVIAKDPNGQSAPVTMSIMVNPAPHLPDLVGALVQGRQGDNLTNILVGSFVDRDALAPSRYSATVDFGDGTDTVAGRIEQVSNSGNNGTYQIFASHIYQKAGLLPLSVTLTKAGLGSVTYVNLATILPLPVALTARLDPTDDHGVSATDWVTNVSTPSFLGTGPAGDRVHVYALPSETGLPPVELGNSIIDASFAWRVTTGRPLPDGSYKIVTTVDNPAGVQVGMLSTGTLVIDTSPPRLTRVSLNPSTSLLDIWVQENGTGLVDGVMANSSLYHVACVQPGGAYKTLPTSVMSSSAASGQVTVHIGTAGPLPAGIYVVTVDPAALIDRAGNQLDGKFTGQFPSGVGQTGVPFVAMFVVTKRTVEGPIPINIAASTHPLPYPAPYFARRAIKVRRVVH